MEMIVMPEGRNRFNSEAIKADRSWDKVLTAVEDTLDYLYQELQAGRISTDEFEVVIKLGE